MTLEELVEKCGEPADKTAEVVDVWSGNVKRGTVTIEKWTYDRGPQAFAMVVTVEDGKIKSMERAR